MLLLKDTKPESIYRVDGGPLDVENNLIESPEGFLIVNSYPSRSGVLRYRNPDGSTRLELRHPDHVFRTDSLSTLAGKPVTVNRHPTEMLNPDNVQKYASGSFNNEVKVVGDGLIKIAINLHRRDGIEAVKDKGLRELSLGYRTDFLPSPGVWRGERYDGLQTNIRYNHGTILANGRAGSECGLPLPLRLDGAEENPKCVQYFDMAVRRDAGIYTPKNNSRRVTGMARIPAGLLPVDLDLDLDPGTASVITQALQAGQLSAQRADSAEAEAAKEKARADGLQSEIDLTNGALWALESDPRFDSDEDDDEMYRRGKKDMGYGKKKKDEDEDLPPFMKKKSKKDMGARKDMPARRDSYDEEYEDEPRFDSEEVFDIAMVLANDINQARTDAMDILSILIPQDDVVIRMDMDGDAIREAVVAGFYPDLPEEHFDSADYVTSRFDSLVDTASQVIEAQGDGGDRQDTYDAYNSYDPSAYGYAPGSNRNDADQLEGLIGASTSGYNTGHDFALRRGPASPDKMDPNVRRSQAWKDPGSVSRGQIMSTGRAGRY